MSDEIEKTIIRIETVLERLEVDVTAIAKDVGNDLIDRAPQMERIEELLEKIVGEAEKQTRLLENLWKNDRSR